MTHKLKSWTFLFEHILSGARTSDIRSKLDRDYAVGDHLQLQEYDPATGTYTGRECCVVITHIIDSVTPCAMSSAVLDHDYAVLSIKRVS